MDDVTTEMNQEFLAFLYNMPDDGGPVSTLFMTVVVAVTGLAWVTRKALALRVWNSMAIFLLVPTAIFDLLDLFGGTENNSIVWVLVMIVESVITIRLLGNNIYNTSNGICTIQGTTTPSNYFYSIHHTCG